MSKNQQKIVKSLKSKNLRARHICWNPVGPAVEMDGYQGGWFIEFETISADENGEPDYIDIIIADNINDAIAEINAFKAD